MCLDSLEGEEEAAGEQDEDQGQVEHTGLPRHHDSAVTVEPVPAREHLPLPAGGSAPVARAGGRLGGALCGARAGGAAAATGADLVVLTRLPVQSRRALDLRHVSSLVRAQVNDVRILPVIPVCRRCVLKVLKVPKVPPFTHTHTQ